MVFPLLLFSQGHLPDVLGQPGQFLHYVPQMSYFLAGVTKSYNDSEKGVEN